MESNTDFSTKGLAVVQTWQNGALSRDSMLDIFRRGEVLPEGRTNEEEVRLIHKEEAKGQRSEARPEKTPVKVLTVDSSAEKEPRINEYGREKQPRHRGTEEKRADVLFFAKPGRSPDRKC